MKHLQFLTLTALAVLVGCESNEVVAPAENLPPTIGAISSKQSPANEAVDAIEFTLSDESPEQVTVTARADNADLVAPDSMEIIGRGATRTLQLQPIADRTGTTRVTLRATDAKGRTGERTFDLSIIRQQRSIAAFARSVFAQPANGLPVPINAIDFVEDAQHDDFADLFD